MSNEARKKAEYTKVRNELFKLLDEFNANNHLVDDPKFKAVEDVVIKNRMSFSEAVELYEKTYPEEK